MAKAKRRVAVNDEMTVPQTKEEADGLIKALVTAQNDRAKLQAHVDDAVQKIRDKNQPKADEIDEDIVRLTRGLQAYANANRDQLTKGGKQKSVKLGNGTIGWRKKPDTVEIDDELALKSLAASKKITDLKEFIKTKITVVKAVVVKNRDLVQGLKGFTFAEGGEQFFVKPKDTKLEERVDAD